MTHLFYSEFKFGGLLTGISAQHDGLSLPGCKQMLHFSWDPTDAHTHCPACEACWIQCVNTFSLDIAVCIFKLIAAHLTQLWFIQGQACQAVHSP